MEMINRAFEEVDAFRKMMESIEDGGGEQPEKRSRYAGLTGSRAERRAKERALVKAKKITTAPR